MSYTILEEIRIRIDEYDANIVEGVRVVTFPENAKLDVKIEELIDKAKQDIKAYRHYPDSYTNEMIEQDILTKYKQVLIDLVLYDWAIEGADFQTQHSENAVNRSFVKKETILGRIIPFCKVYAKED